MSTSERARAEQRAANEPTGASRDVAKNPPSHGPDRTTGAAAAMAGEIERLANQFFSGVPGPAVGSSAQAPAGMAPTDAAPPLAPFWSVPLIGTTALGPLAPPAWGPSALAVGAGGASPAVALPPVPGAVKQPPLPVAPPPRESDLRVIPGMFSDNLGLSSPVAVALAPEGTTGSPYFLELAGPPATGSRTSPALPLPAAPPWNLGSSAPPPPNGGHPAMASVTRPVGVGSTSLPSPVDADDHAREPYFLALAGNPRGAATETPSAQSLGQAADASDFRPEIAPEVRLPAPLFDGDTVKRDFPILRERVHGRPLVWLDNAATTQKPQVVIDRLSYYYEHENSNVHRAAHALAARATDAYESARDTVRRFLNAPSAQNIVFVRGTTEAVNLVAKSWGERFVGRDDEIVITWLEHHANIVPWQQLCAQTGARLRVAPVDARGDVILEEYERLLGPRTRLVSFSQVSNALGTIVPAREMIEMAHRHGALTLVDGAQAVSHMRVDVQALDCDFYCFSGHKIFGPTGIGVLYGKEDALSSMPPWQGGGNMIANVTFDRTTYQPPPQRFEAGTGSIADAVALGAALDYVTALGMENVTRYEHELLVYATEGLARVPGLRMIGAAADKAAVLSFVLDGVRTEDVGAALDQEGIAVRSGHHCAQPILRRFGVESTVRASLAPYNTRADIDALVAALLRLQTGRPQLRDAARG